MSAVLNDLKSGAVNDAQVPAKDGIKIEREEHKLEKRLCRDVGRAIVAFLDHVEVDNCPADLAAEAFL